MLRFLSAITFIGLFLVFSIPVMGIEWIVGKFNKEKADYQSLRIVQWALRKILFFTGTTVTVIGEENIPDEPVLFIGNHRSYLDIVITYARCKRLTGYVAKKEMLKYPLLRDWMKRLYCLFLDRKNMKEGLKTILQAMDHIKNGISICIFPEGTRNKGEELSLLEFHAGSFKIAEKTGCAIIPMTLNNSYSIWERQFPRVKKTHVVLEYGKPIYPHELKKEDRKHIAAYCRNIIAETLKKNEELV